jgi:DNA invertase Pin-like site-specific DNA recombinase
MNKHVAIYVRVSSARQDLASQLPDLERWAAAQETEVRFYRDKFTGKTLDRPGWIKLQSAIDRGEVFMVVCWRLDRLGRTAKGLTALFADLTERKIPLVSLKDGIDLSTASGRMLANVLASVAQFETELRAERVRAGQAAAKAAGKSIGGRKAGSPIVARIGRRPSTWRTLHVHHAEFCVLMLPTGILALPNDRFEIVASQLASLIT